MSNYEKSHRLKSVLTNHFTLKSELLIHVKTKCLTLEYPGLNIDHISRLPCISVLDQNPHRCYEVRGGGRFGTWPKGAISLRVILISTHFFLFISVCCCFQGWRSRKCQPLWMCTVLPRASLECVHYSILFVSLARFPSFLAVITPSLLPPFCYWNEYARDVSNYELKKQKGPERWTGSLNTAQLISTV